MTPFHTFPSRWLAFSLVGLAVLACDRHGNELIADAPTVASQFGQPLEELGGAHDGILCGSTGQDVVCTANARSRDVFDVADLSGASALTHGTGPLCGVVGTERSLRCVDFETRSTPVPPSIATGVVQASASHDLVCYVTTDGGVTCNPNLGTTAVALPLSGRRAVQVVVGATLVCVLTDAGSVRCWAADLHGEGSDVAGVTGAIQLAMTDEDARLDSAKRLLNHTCAVLTDGRVMCWGANDDGQLGDGKTYPTTGRATVVLDGATSRPLVDAVEVQVGPDHSCARLSDGTVRCWGRSGLFAASDFHSLTASVVPALSDVKSILIGVTGDCALLNSGDLVCWGGTHSPPYVPYSNPWSLS